MYIQITVILFLILVARLHISIPYFNYTKLKIVIGQKQCPTTLFLDCLKKLSNLICWYNCRNIILWFITKNELRLTIVKYSKYNLLYYTNIIIFGLRVGPWQVLKVPTRIRVYFFPLPCSMCHTSLDGQVPIVESNMYTICVQSYWRVDYLNPGEKRPHRTFHDICRLPHFTRMLSNIIPSDEI